MSTYATLYTDGACNNITHAGMGMGICIRVGVEPEQDYYVYLRSYNGKTTSNIAEFLALLHGLRLCKGQGITRVKIHCDSQVLVRGVTGEYDIKVQPIKNLMKEIHALLDDFDYTIQWIPRNLNKQADKLSKLAIECQAST
jgi:ribonuclease HI